MFLLYEILPSVSEIYSKRYSGIIFLKNLNMFSLVQKAVGYLSESVADAEVSSSKCERPRLEDFISPSNFEKEEFEGVVTLINGRDVIVNNDIYYSIPLSQSSISFKVGDTVQGTAERKSKYEAWRATRLTHWSVDEKWDDDRPKFRSQVISSRDLDAGIPGILKQDLFPTDGSKLTSAKKECIQEVPSCNEVKPPTSVIGQVKGIAGGTITVNDNYFSLSGVVSSFELAEGDWVVLRLSDASSTTRDPTGLLCVSHVDPLRKKTIKGEVTRAYPKHIVINNEVFCSRNVTKAVVPSLQIGDVVTVDVIESDCGPFGWRAVSLSLDVSAPVIKDTHLSLTRRVQASKEGTHDLMSDKQGITIPQSLKFARVQLNSMSYLTVPVKNGGEQEQTLSRAYFVTATQDSQFTVESNCNSETDRFAPVSLLPHETFCIELTCKGRYLGQCRQLCVFDFGSFKIGRYVTATVEDKHMMIIGPTVPYAPVKKRATSSVYRDESRIIRGERPFKAPAFLPTSLPQYNVPLELFMGVVNKMDVIELAPLLDEVLTPENYQDYFSTLLHLEEIEMILQIRKFDMDRAVFYRSGEFMTLDVPGLAEKRPSLMIGDSVVASSPGDVGGTRYEGCIHEVLHNKILLKFHPSFHSTCEGRDYSISFNFNRTPLRRCHFALKFTLEQLGTEVLFPKKIMYRLPQVVYVDPESFEQSYPKRTSVDIDAWKASHQKEYFLKPSAKLDQVTPTARSLSEHSCLESNDIAVVTTERCFGPDAHGSNDIRGNGNLVAVDKGKFYAGHTNCGSDNVKCHKQYAKLGAALCTQNHGQNINKSPNNSVSRDHLNGKCSEGVFGVNAKSGSSLSNLKNSPKGVTNSVTPARIPVVTRLFGVPSSGSSANSSICCSDDESKMNSESEGEIKLRKFYPKKKLFSEFDDSLDNDDVDCKKECKGANVDIGLCLGAQERGIMTNIKAVRELNMPKSVNWSIEKKPESHMYDEIQSDVFNCDKLDYDNQMKAVPNNSHRVLSDKVGQKNIRRKLPESGSVLDGQKSLKKETQVKTISFEELKSGDKNALVTDYCVPILPKRSSTDEFVTSGKVPLLKWFNKALNLEQKLAVQRILEGSTRPIPYIVYGPPGTGKTSTLVEAILQIYTLVKHCRLLIVTPSNSAADLVTERLVGFDLLEKADLVRLNAYQRKEDAIPEGIRSYCYNGDELSLCVRQRVIITTATTAGVMYRFGLHNGHFTHVFVDEAGQLTEPECLVALGLVNSVSGQVVLAGDPKQLGPVIQSRLAKEYGLQESLLHRLCNSVLYQPEDKSNGHKWSYEPRLVTQLVNNYRSHEDIISTSSKLFYHDCLISLAKSEVKQRLLGWKELPNPSCPLLFHAVVGENLQEGDSPSWFNPTETFQVVRYSKSLISYGLRSSEIGIITPYRKQVDKIRQLLTVFGVEDGIKVGTVEEFQGQERTAIIISTVRSSEELLKVDVNHSLGFVKCPKRFNVALTRAQSLLVVVGNPYLLALDTCWLSFINFCISRKAYVGAEFQSES